MAESDQTSSEVPSFAEAQRAWIENLVASKLAEESTSSTAAAASTSANPSTRASSDCSLSTAGKVMPSECVVLAVVK